MVRARRAITRDGERAVAVAVTDGRIAAIESFESDSRAPRTVDLTDDEVLLPGMVDIPVHVNEPGRTEWEGFATATRPTAAGGVTTIIDTPLNSLPPTVDVAAPPSADNSPEPAPAVFGPVKRSLPNRPDPTRLRATPTATPEHSDIGSTCRRREPSGIDAAV